MKKAQPDKVFTYTVKPVIWGTLATRLAGVPEIYSMITGLGMSFSKPKSLKGRVFRNLVRMLYRGGVGRSTKVFFQNPDDYQDFVDNGILADTSKAVRTMGSGVNLERFPRMPLPQGPMVFLLIARLLKEKGILEFVEAAQSLKPSYPDARFVVVGPHDPSLSHAVSQSELDDWMAAGQVEFIGHVNDVRPWLEQASVFVLPSYYREGTPRSALEAMATGRAVITADAPGCRETVTDGETGFLVPPRDVDSLADAMRSFLTDGGLAARMGEASYQEAVASYDVRSVNKTILEAMNL
jgi:glycosyltransferase involved in cell wall biosynthesis